MVTRRHLKCLKEALHTNNILRPPEAINLCYPRYPAWNLRAPAHNMIIFLQ